MFDRKLFKSNAKMMLKRYYWQAFLVGLIITGGTALLALLSLDFNPYYYIKFMYAFFARMVENDYTGAQQAIQMAQNSGSVSELSGFFSTVYTAFTYIVTPVLTVSVARFFIHSRENKANLKELLTPFKKNFGSNLGTLLLQHVLIGLWMIIPVFIAIFAMMLPLIFWLDSNANYEINNGADMIWMIISMVAMYFVVFAIGSIPATVKTLEYSMLPYIMAENQKMNYKRAFQLTKAMTKGYKWNLFVLNLSFIGWNMLALIVPFGSYFLAPYTNATYAEVYTFLKAQVIRKGLASPDEFPGLRERPASPAEPAAPAQQPSEALPAEATASLSETEAPVAPPSEAEAISVPEIESIPEIASVPEIAPLPEVESVPETDAPSFTE